jgi:CubicO group peptidase (beta-lactamase class C family)
MRRLATLTFLFLAIVLPVNAAPFAGLARHLAALAKTDGLSGVVLIAKDGKPVFARAYGYANLADRIPNRIDTRFNMASMGKMFTAVAVMQLVEAGKIASLQDKVGKYLPNYPSQAVREQVTVEQLLTHTSGMGNFWEQLADKAKDRYRAVADYLPLFADEKLAFEPGKGFAYSNNGYTVLGLIVEAASGEDYFDYLRRHIYAPCAMSDTGAYALDEPVARIATGYTRSTDKPGALVSNIYTLPYKGSPAGGSYTTAADLLKFADALVGDKLLNHADTEALTAGKVDYGTRRYGYGITEDHINGHRVIGHGGGNTGIADELLIFTDLGTTAVILTNGDVENFWDVENFIKRDLTGPTAETRSFDFTRALIDAAVASGYDAGAKMLSASDHPAIRGGLMEQIGYRLLWQGRVAQGAAVFRLYALASPAVAYAWLGFGVAAERARDKPGAIDAYARYLALEPDDKDAQARLKLLRGS